MINLNCFSELYKEFGTDINQMDNFLASEEAEKIFIPKILKENETCIETLVVKKHLKSPLLEFQWSNSETEDSLKRLVKELQKITFDEDNSTTKHIRNFYMSTFDKRKGFMNAYSLAAIVGLKRFYSGDERASQILSTLEKMQLPKINSSPQEVLELINRFVLEKLKGGKTTISLKKIQVIGEEPLQRYQSLKNSGIDCLTHITKMENIVLMLKLGKLIPAAPLVIPGTKSGAGGLSMHGNNYVFVNILPKVTKDDFKKLTTDHVLFEYLFNTERFPENVILIFSKKILLNTEFHYNRRWRYGIKDEDTIEGKDIGNLLTKVGKGDRKKLIRQSELMIEGSIDLSLLKAIWVRPEKRDELITTLKENQIEFKNDPDFSLIKAVENFPESLILKDE